MKHKIMCLLLFLVLAGIYIWTNEKLTFYMLKTMVAAVAFAVISNLIAARGLEVEIITTSDNSPHDNMVNGKIEISFRNKSVFPVFRCDMVLNVMNLLTGSEMKIEKTYMIGPFGKQSDSILLQTRYCGRVETDIVKIDCIDWFSLTRRGCRAVSRGHYYIYPEYADLDIDDTLKQRAYNSRMETYLNRKGNDPTEILDIRDYNRGDSVKMIHWKLSAKWKKKMVRELDMPSNQDTLLVFGLFGEKDGENINKLAEYVLSLSHALLQGDIHHDAVMLDKEGRLIRVYCIDGEESYGSFEKRLLNGGISLSGEDVNSYVMRHESVWRYSSLIYVSNERPEELADADSLIYMEIK